MRFPGRTTTLLATTVAMAVMVATLTACSDGVIGGGQRDARAMGDAPTYDVTDPVRAKGGAVTASAEAIVNAFPECAPASGAGTTADEGPARLVCTGLYADRSLITVAATVAAYEPALTLFSDNSVKSRWIQLPAGQRIDTSNMDEWVFPIGTKLWKQFVLAGQRIETRFLWKVSATRWVKATYRWSSDQRDALRFDDGARIAIGNQTGDASYEIPSVAKCDQCHSGRIDKVLGFEAVGLGITGATGLTLPELAGRGMLSTNPATATIAIPEDATGLARPALGWMHSNCGLSCHNTSPGAFARAKGMDLRLTYAELAPQSGAATVASLSAYRTTYGVAAARPAGNFARITPGSADTSAIPILAGRRDPVDTYAQMPPGLSHVVDESGIASLRNWINALQ